MMRMKMTSDRRNVGHSDDESDEMFLSMTVDCDYVVRNCATYLTEEHIIRYLTATRNYYMSAAAVQ